MMISLTRAQNIDLDVAYFRDNGIVSTAENIAVFFWRALARDDAEIGKLVCLVALLVCSAKFFVVVVVLFQLCSVRVDETEKNSCTFTGQG